MSWNGSARYSRRKDTPPEAHKNEQGRKRTGWGVIAAGAAALALVVGALVWWQMRPAEVVKEEPRRGRDTKPRRIAETRTPSKPVVRQPQETKPERPKAEVIGKTPTGEEYVAVEASTNSTGVVESLYTLADGSKKRVVMLQSRDTLVFDNDFDNMLGLIGTTPLDQKLPPLPELGDMEEQFKKAMKSPIIIREEDSEQAKKMKEAALALRLEINDLMREGYTLTQILSEYETLRDRNVKERHAFQAELNEIYNSGDIEGARAYLKTANEKLEEFGIIPLTMPGEGQKRRKVQ